MLIERRALAPARTLHQCPVCRTEVARFKDGPGGRPNAKCPHCRSLARHRFLALLLQRLAPVLATGGPVLDIAPQQALQSMLARIVGPRYVGLDISPHRQVDLVGSLERLPFPTASFDAVLCYHVLEHVVDDSAAIRELARVLTPGGIVFLQVPIRRGQPTEDDPHAPSSRLFERFGHVDHRRLYGDDLEMRLATHGLVAYPTFPRDFVSPEEHLFFALNDQPVWLCRRGPASTGQPPALDASVLRQLAPPPSRADEPSPPAPRKATHPPKGTATRAPSAPVWARVRRRLARSWLGPYLGPPYRLARAGLRRLRRW